jgi:hypothetical protein
MISSCVSTVTLFDVVVRVFLDEIRVAVCGDVLPGAGRLRARASRRSTRDE